jgi:hypothetical protein
MSLTDEQIESFRTIMRDVRGIELTKAEAFTQGTMLVNLMKVIGKPMTQKEFDAIQVERIKTLDLKRIFGD